MDIDKGSIYELLNGQCQYIVPVYQRKYSWLADVQCAKLWDDIVKMEKGQKKHHFCGIHSVNDNVKVYHPIRDLRYVMVARMGVKWAV